MRAEVLEDKIPDGGLDTAVAFSKGFQLIHIQELRQGNADQGILPVEADKVARHVHGGGLFQYGEVFPGKENVMGRQVVPVSRECRGGAEEGMRECCVQVKKNRPTKVERL